MARWMGELDSGDGKEYFFSVSSCIFWLIEDFSLKVVMRFFIDNIHSVDVSSSQV